MRILTLVSAAALVVAPGAATAQLPQLNTTLATASRPPILRRTGADLLTVFRNTEAGKAALAKVPQLASGSTTSPATLSVLTIDLAQTLTSSITWSNGPVTSDALFSYAIVNPSSSGYPWFVMAPAYGTKQASIGVMVMRQLPPGWYLFGARFVNAPQNEGDVKLTFDQTTPTICTKAGRQYDAQGGFDCFMLFHNTVANMHAVAYELVSGLGTVQPVALTLTYVGP